MHSRVLRVKCSALSKSFKSTSPLGGRASRTLRPVQLLHRRNMSIIPSASTPPPNEPQEEEKPAARRGRPRTKQGLDPKSGDSAQLPPELAESLLWVPEDEPHPRENSLPPDQLMQDALANLHVSLLPKTQHRATHTTSAGPPVEPSITLYCPIEGGTYVIDETVRELARRTNSEVLTLDALDLLAGEWGPYGKAATALQLPSNPLQLGEFQHARQPSRDEDSDDEGDMGSVVSQAVEGMQSGRPPFGITIQTRKISSGSSSHQSRKQFFQDLVNIQRKGDEDAEPRPRLIYCRDLQVVNESLQHWFPTLVEAVRLRRQGPMPRAQGPIHSPTVIILGVSPSIITPRTTPFPGSESGGLVNFIINRNRPGMSGRGPVSPPSPPKIVEWDESNAAQRARDKRLLERLSNWEKHDASVFYPELPNLHISSDSPNFRGPPRGLMSLFVALPGGGGPPAITPAPQDEDSPRERPSDHARITVILPRLREPGQEKGTRIQRRLQSNEINIRTAIGAVGGTLPGDALRYEAFTKPDPEPNALQQMISDWTQRVETWQRIKLIADRALGLFAQPKSTADKSTPELIDLPWTALATGWENERVARTTRKTLLSNFNTKRVVEHAHPERTQQTEDGEEYGEESDSEMSDVEELIEQLRRDPSLDQHEQRLLGSIVNPKHLPTTFADVHLPATTIDSIRTIVSLPLLQPAAFKYGVLKQHGMNGALLFGAPGTGKTLSVRALARESGARMMIVKPSDVMDMYVGEGEKLVRAVFSLARRISPCVVFLDEIDALLGARYSSRGGGGDLAHRGVITEFMQEMDGLKSSRDTNVVVIGATNRPFDLDDAVLRRLPRRLLIDLPGEKEREAILRIHLTGEQLAEDVNIATLAQKTESFSGSDLKHLCVAAALDAVKEHAHLPWNVPKDSTSASTDVETQAKSEVVKPPESEHSADTIAEPTTEASPSVENEEGEDISDSDTEDVGPRRVLRMSHFDKALKEITPSASEQLGSLADLRKWNEEFGEGGRKRGRRIWGGKFGFIVKPEKTEEGRVQQP